VAPGQESPHSESIYLSLKHTVFPNIISNNKIPSFCFLNPKLKEKNPNKLKTYPRSSSLQRTHIIPKISL
jgi:hypothetical protein